MIPTKLFAFVVGLSSLVAVNGALIQRDGTFTSLTPHPTWSGGSNSTTASMTASGTPSGNFTTASMTPSATPSGNSTTSSTTPTGNTTTTTMTKSSNGTTATTSPTSTTMTTMTMTTMTTSPTTKSPTSTLSGTTSSTPTGTQGMTTTVTVTVTGSCPVGSSSSTTKPAASATPTSGTADCTGIQQWQAAFAYVAGNKVIYNNQLFTARQWTYDNAPPAHLDQWSAGGICAQPINNKANCAGVAAWSSIVAYTTGKQVTYNGHLWSAVQWIESNAPGDASGSWKDLGVCA